MHLSYVTSYLMLQTRFVDLHTTLLPRRVLPGRLGRV